MDLFENEGYQLLIKALVSMETEEECKAFLNDLMTRKELADIAQRILVLLAREFLAHSSADGRMKSRAISLYIPAFSSSFRESPIAHTEVIFQPSFSRNPRSEDAQLSAA